MANFIHRTNFQLIFSGNTPDYTEPTWKEIDTANYNDLKVEPAKYRTIDTDVARVMTQAEKDAYDAANPAPLPVPDLVKTEHRSDGSVTSGYIRYEGVWLDVTKSTTNTLSLTWNYPVDLLNGRFYAVIDQADNSDAADPADEFWSYCDIGVVGVTTQAHVANDTVINVSQTVIDNVDAGHFVVIGSGDTTKHEVVSKDTGALTITIGGTGLVDSPATSSTVSLYPYFAGIPGTGIKFPPGVKNMIFGGETFDGANLPTGKALIVEYTNTSATIDKRLIGDIVILY